jgi:putative transposase
MLKVVGNEAAQDETDGRSLLDEIAREGARRMLVAALETEVAAYLEAHREERDEHGHALVVRNGKGRTRKVTVGAGTIPVSAPRVNDRRTDQDGERRRFTSRILPPYMRRSPKVAEVLPVLYLRGLSTGDFREALAALVGDDAAGLSATNIARLTNEWEAEYHAFQKRSLADRDYVYVWVDGVHFNVRLEDDRLCTLVMIGVRPDGTKELITVEDGYRESAESWKTVLRDLKRRGMRPPVVAVGDGALGFWAAVREVWPKTREQRDWFHKLGNILDKLPKRLQPREGRAPRGHVRRDPRAGPRRGATVRHRVRRQVSEGRHDPGEGRRRPAHILRLPRRALKHLRTSNVIESPFATVRLRQRVTKGAGSRTKGLLMAYKLLDMAQARWRRLDGAHLLAFVRAGIVFVDGVQQEGKASRTRARAA